MRFQEKDVLRKQIEELHDRVDEEERTTNQLEEKLTRAQTENTASQQKLNDFEKEQEIGETFYEIIIWNKQNKKKRIQFIMVTIWKQMQMKT